MKFTDIDLPELNPSIAVSNELLEVTIIKATLSMTVYNGICLDTVHMSQPYTFICSDIAEAIESRGDFKIYGYLETGYKLNYGFMAFANIAENGADVLFDTIPEGDNIMYRAKISSNDLKKFIRDVKDLAKKHPWMA